MGLVDAGIVGVSVAGVAALASGNLAGPLALATPALVALAVGIVLAHLLTPVAAAVGRRSLARGRLTATLTAVQIARRPAVRRIVTIITVATALAVFAVNALVVGQDNRQLRSRVETGAAVVLTTDSDDPARVEKVLRQVDPAAAKATPVAWIRQGSSESITTMAVMPEEFARVADLAVDPAAFDLRPLQVAGTLPEHHRNPSLGHHRIERVRRDRRGERRPETHRRRPDPGRASGQTWRVRADPEP